MHLRNAPSEVMDELGYGKGYIYPHDYKGHYAPQQYLPDEVVGTPFWRPADNAQEAQLLQRLRQMKGEPE